MNDIELYKETLAIKKALKRFKEEQPPEISTPKNDNEGKLLPSENSSSNQSITEYSLTNDSAFEELFKKYPEWMTLKKVDYAGLVNKGDDKGLLDYIDLLKFHADTKSIKYSQMGFIYLKDVIEISKKKYNKYNFSTFLTNKYGKTKAQLRSADENAENFWAYFPQFIKEQGVKEHIDKATNTSELRSILDRFFGAEQTAKKPTEKQSLKTMVDNFVKSDNFAINHYILYLSWVLFCQRLQQVDLQNYGRFKYILYDYFNTAESDKSTGEVSGNLQTVLDDYYCTKDFWLKRYYPKFIDMCNKAYSDAKVTAKNYITNVNQVALNENEALNEVTIVKFIKDETNKSLLDFLLTTTKQKKVVGNTDKERDKKLNKSRMIFNVIEQAYQLDNPPCIMWYAPQGKVQEEKNKKSALSNAYKEKRNKINNVRYNFKV